VEGEERGRRKETRTEKKRAVWCSRLSGKEGGKEKKRAWEYMNRRAMIEKKNGGGQSIGKKGARRKKKKEKRELD